MPADTLWLPQGGGRLGRVLGVGSLLVAAGLLVASLLALNNHPGGDPGHKVFDQLTKIRAAVPPGATAVKVQNDDPVQWFPGCGSASRAGWGGELYGIDFTDPSSKIAVVLDINTVLERQGWHPDPTPATPSQGSLAHWYLDIEGGRRANAFAYPLRRGPHDWYFTASWQTPGPQTEGCG
ncbi:MAG TPA: hypothetical protein VGG38_15315 [Acidimicrobiales bacterium]